MTRVLLTAFEPFGGEAVNPSQLAVARLADEGVDGVELVTASLPVVYYAAADRLRAAVAEHDPDVVVCTGQAGGRFGVTPEKVAVNRNDTVMPDNDGQHPVDEPVAADGPVGYFTTLPVAAMVAALREADVPAEVSWSAGTYVCNHVFYSLMHLLATEPPRPGRPARRGGFVHLPYAHQQVLGRTDPQPSLSLATLTHALGIVVRTGVDVADDVPLPAGPAPAP